MAEPMVHDVAVNPCAHCAGVRKVEQREWRTPQFLVHCLGCGNVADGESVEEAVAAWNEANEARDVDPEDVKAMAVAMVTPKMTHAFLDALHEAAETYAQQGGKEKLQPFLNWCEQTAAQ